MASLMEELISTLEEEDTIYNTLIPINEEKTKIIINNDLDALQKITENEQAMIVKINGLEHKRQKVLANIGIVINRDSASLDIKTMVHLLAKQPKEQKQLSQVHDSLKRTIHRLMELNRQNQSLIEQSLELIDFNINFVQSIRTSPWNNYDKNATGMEQTYEQASIFDTKQ